MALQPMHPLNINTKFTLKLNPNIIDTTASSLLQERNLRLKGKKCLFGPADPLDTYRMVKENLDEERRRFYERFGIHIEDLDKITEEKPTTRKISERRTSSASSRHHNRALKPYNRDINQQQQMRMTDFCQVKRSPTTTKLTEVHHLETGVNNNKSTSIQ